MGTAYFIVLDSEEPGFDPFVDGKLLTKRLSSVNKIARSLGLKQFEDYAFQDLSEFGGPDMELEWFDADEGIRWASGILQHIRENPTAVKDVDEVAEDLADYIRVFKEADKRGLKWHLELDF
jgi:hypothetical protein